MWAILLDAVTPMTGTLKTAVGVGCGVVIAAAAFLVGYGLGITRAEIRRSHRTTTAATTPATEVRPDSAGSIPTQAQHVPASPRLKVEVIRFDERSGYFHVRGLVKNTSDEPVRFVKVEALYVDSSGKTLDTDWTYAVDSHPLAPGGRPDV